MEDQHIITEQQNADYRELVQAVSRTKFEPYPRLIVKLKGETKIVTGIKFGKWGVEISTETPVLSHDEHMAANGLQELNA